MLRLLNDSEMVTLDGKPMPGAFAIDEKAGIVRCYVLDEEGNRVLEGERTKVETTRGAVVVESKEAENEGKSSRRPKRSATETGVSQQEGN